MGQIKPPKPIKLIVGLIFKDLSICKQTEYFLKKRFGDIDAESLIIPFNHTDYYKDELGENLLRKFFSFRKLVKLENISKIKTLTNTIESKLSQAKKRTINIDPGYLDLNKLVLLTTKDYSHRIYLSRGIFAEVTLHYQNSTFQPWPWTYPDYKTKEYIDFFNQVRKIYAQQIKAK